MRTVGVVSRGVRCPVFKEGDNLVAMVTESIVEMGKEQHVTFHPNDIVAVTEAVVARPRTATATKLTAINFFKPFIVLQPPMDE